MFLPKDIGTMCEEGVLPDEAVPKPWRGLLQRKNAASQRQRIITHEIKIRPGSVRKPGLGGCKIRSNL
jgi:hypothetical protein